MDLLYQRCQLLHFERLTPRGVDKTTFHLELSWDPSVAYRAGDSLAIRPHNSPELVESVLSRLSPTPLDLAPMRQSLVEHYSLSRLSSKLLKQIAQNGSAKENQELLIQSLEEREVAKQLLEKRDLFEILTFFDATLSPEQLKDALLPLLPRFYSIASSFLADPSRIALTIAHVNYYHHNQRLGVCSDYLLRLGQSGSGWVEAAIHPTRDFHLADSSRDIIMVGPGTGVAPFRAFMQERLASHASGRSWLFFGERYRNCLFYESFWQSCSKQLDFRMSCAFSREEAKKVYVQDRLKQHASEIAVWMQTATFYLCGDAKQMAKDVEQALLEIFMQEEQLDELGAKAKLKAIKAEGRFLRDVY